MAHLMITHGTLQHSGWESLTVSLKEHFTLFVCVLTFGSQMTKRKEAEINPQLCNEEVTFRFNYYSSQFQYRDRK